MRRQQVLLTKIPAEGSGQDGMSRKKRRRKKKGYGMIVFLSLLIIACIVVIVGLASGKLTDKVKTVVKEKVTQEVMEQAVQKALESSGDPQAAQKAKEIVDNMEESDKQKAEEIIEKYADSDTLSDCLEMVSDGVNEESIAQVRDYLEETVSAEDQAQLEELYRKYSEGY